MTKRCVVLLTVLVSLATITSAAPVYAVNSVQPGNRPSPIVGQKNGLVAASELVTIEGDCRLASDAAGSFVNLLRAARGDGINLGMASCYRPLADQISVRGNVCGNGNCACAATISSTATVGTSYHGWGKAVDFTVDGRSLTDPFSPAERWLNTHAAAYGWNHPAFALLGTVCPEAWHWEWVGDGGMLHGTPVKADVTAGFGRFGSLGYVTGTGAVRWISGLQAPSTEFPITPLASVIVGAAATPAGLGLWRVGSDGGVFTSGDAAYYGSTGAMHLNRPIIAMEEATEGYWLLASDGGVFSFGIATFHGSTGAMHLNRPVVNMAPTPGAEGYWLVASDGGIFSFGDAKFYGSTGAIRLNSPIVAMAPTSSFHGYWLVAADGGVFSFGDAVFYGSGAGRATAPVVDIVRTNTGFGYSLIAANGSVLRFGDA